MATLLLCAVSKIAIFGTVAIGIDNINTGLLSMQPLICIY